MQKYFDCVESRAALVHVYLFIEAETLSLREIKLKEALSVNFVLSKYVCQMYNALI